MNKLFILSIFLISLTISAERKDWFLEVKPCLSCGWIQLQEPFRLREQCEMVRNGIFTSGMTRCSDELFKKN